MALKFSKNDVLLFPFADEHLNEGLGMEFSVYFGWGLKTLSLKSKTPKNGFPGKLVIIGHGSGDDGYRHHLCGDGGLILPKDLAKHIKGLAFPSGSKPEIVVWSCNSGVVGGYAQLLTLHLINEGYIGKKVWGCTTYTGVARPDFTLTVADSQSAARQGRIRDANGGDITYFVGAGGPLASSSSAAI